MYTDRDFYVTREVQQDRIRWAARERLAIAVSKPLIRRIPPLHRHMLYWVGRQLVNSGGYLERRYRFTRELA